jgi:hypothetical protein
MRQGIKECERYANLRELREPHLVDGGLADHSYGMDSTRKKIWRGDVIYRPPRNYSLL